MGVNDALGLKGISICKTCSETRLLIKLDDKKLDAVKEHTKSEDEDRDVKCHVCSQIFVAKDCINADPEMMADAIDKQIEQSENLHNLYKKEKKVPCPKCGVVLDATERLVTCNQCKTEVNTKKVGKQFKFGQVKKIAMRLYAKQLRKNANQKSRVSLPDDKKQEYPETG